MYFSRYKDHFKEDFPDYEITTHPGFYTTGEKDTMGGFGYRPIPKTGAGAKKEEAVEGAYQFGGLVKAVACNKVRII